MVEGELSALPLKSKAAGISPGPPKVKGTADWAYMGAETGTVDACVEDMGGGCDCWGCCAAAAGLYCIHSFQLVRSSAGAASVMSSPAVVSQGPRMPPKGKSLDIMGSSMLLSVAVRASGGGGSWRLVCCCWGLALSLKSSKTQ